MNLGLLLHALTLTVGLLACKTTRISSNVSANPVGSFDNNLYRKELTDVDQFEEYSEESEGLIQGGRSMKFFIDLKGGSGVYFINNNWTGRCAELDYCYKNHFHFGERIGRVTESLEVFNRQVYGSGAKPYVAGTLASYGEGKDLLFAIQMNPSDTGSEEILLKVATLVKAAIKIEGHPINFAIMNNLQVINRTKPQFDALGIKVMTVDDIMGSNAFRAMHTGEAYGYLRLFPANQDKTTPTDIVVFDELPLDLTVVAGVITKAYQDTNSHINLKSKQRGTPNMILRTAGEDVGGIKAWANKPVHLVVTKSGYKIEPATAQEIESRYAAKINKAWTTGGRILSSELLMQSYDDMCPTSAAECLKKDGLFGSKVANLGFLKKIWKDRSVPEASPLTYDPIPVGFGVSVQYYSEFIKANPAVALKLANLVEKEKAQVLSAEEKTTLSEEIRSLILNAELPQKQLDETLRLMASTAPGVTKWKIRSSSSAEDLPNFDGAGLHDSYTSKLDKSDTPDHKCELVADNDDTEGEGGVVTKMEVKPKTVACAIKGVYASLWNRRAIDERSYARLDHAKVSMGLTILPSYSNESPVVANSVVITRVINSPDVWGYNLSIQKDNNTVTNPAPGTWSELTVARPLGIQGEAGTLTTIRFAKPTKNEPVFKTTVLNTQQTMLMAKIAMKTEIAYCQAVKGYFTANSCANVSKSREKTRALDMEMKLLANGQFVLKQVREFSGK